jgi:hypothetical protein
MVYYGCVYIGMFTHNILNIWPPLTTKFFLPRKYVSNDEFLFIWMILFRLFLIPGVEVGAVKVNTYCVLCRTFKAAMMLDDWRCQACQGAVFLFPPPARD